MNKYKFVFFIIVYLQVFSAYSRDYDLTTEELTLGVSFDSHSPTNINNEVRFLDLATIDNKTAIYELNETKGLVLRDPDNVEIGWCDAKPVLTHMLSNTADFQTQFTLDADQYAYYKTADEVTLKIPKGFYDDAWWETGLSFLTQGWLTNYVNTSDLDDYDYRLENYVDIFSELFSYIMVQELLDDEKYSSIRERTFEYVIDPLSQDIGDTLGLIRVGKDPLSLLSDFSGNYADLYTKWLRDQNKVSGLKRLGNVAKISQVVFAAASKYSEESEKIKFLNRAMAFPFVEMRMVTVLNLIESSSVKLDPALIEGARLAYEMISAKQFEMIDAVYEGLKAGGVTGLNIVIGEAISAGLKALVTNGAITGKAAAKLGGAAAGLIQLAFDNWDFESKVTFWILLLNTSEKLISVFDDVLFTDTGIIPPPNAYREAFSFTNSASLYTHKWAYNIFIDDVKLSQSVWYLKPTWYQLKTYLNQTITRLENQEVGNYLFLRNIDNALDLIESVYKKTCNTPPKVITYNITDIQIVNTSSIGNISGFIQSFNSSIVNGIVTFNLNGRTHSANVYTEAGVYKFQINFKLPENQETTDLVFLSSTGSEVKITVDIPANPIINTGSGSTIPDNNGSNSISVSNLSVSPTVNDKLRDTLNN